MKILFLSFPWIVDILGIGYLSSVLKKEGHLVFITRPKTLWEDIYGLKPDMIAVSTPTGQHISYLRLAREIKKHCPHIKIVFGGAHPTYFPEIAEENCIDYIIRGEGEASFLRLVKAIESGQVLPGKERQIDPLIQKLDTLPFPDRELIYKYPENYLNPIKNVFTSRGCPFNCSYCYMSAFRELYKGQHVLRHRSIDNIIAECRELSERYPAKFIFFADDEFAVSGKRLDEFAEKYRKKVGLPFHCQLRIDYLTEEKVRVLKGAGCYSVTFAIETGSQATRWFALNKRITDEQIVSGVALLRKYGLRFRIENMIGLPGESLDAALKTLDFNIDLKPTISWVSLYQPYPKTKLGEFCKGMGLFDGKTDNFKENFFEDTVLAINRKREFVNLQRLFGFIVAFPFLRRIIRLLIKAPVNRLYWRIYKAHKRFLYNHRLYKIR